jgi:MSHA pilin protein MshC
MGIKKSLCGFTLVELVTVILLLGILSAVILPRFSSRDGFAEYAVRDQLISTFRLAQQRAMYDHSGACYRLFINSDGFGAQRDGSYFGVAGSDGEITLDGDYKGVSITGASAIYFDGVGNAYADGCGTTAVANPLSLSVQGLVVQIYPTGFIRAN